MQLRNKFVFGTIALQNRIDKEGNAVVRAEAYCEDNITRASQLVALFLSTQNSR